MENAHERVCDDCWIVIFSFLPQNTVVHTMSHISKSINYCATVCINNRQDPIIATVTPAWFDKNFQVKEPYKKLQNCKNLSLKVKLENMTLSRLIELLNRYAWKNDKSLFIYSGTRIKNILKVFKKNLVRIEIYNFYFKKFTSKEMSWLQKKTNQMERKTNFRLLTMPHIGMIQGVMLAKSDYKIKKETIRLIESVGLPALSTDDWNIATKLTRVSFHPSCHGY